jgi:hypothetical protein
VHMLSGSSKDDATTKLTFAKLVDTTLMSQVQDKTIPIPGGVQNAGGELWMTPAFASNVLLGTSHVEAVFTLAHEMGHAVSASLKDIGGDALRDKLMQTDALCKVTETAPDHSHFPEEFRADYFGGQSVARFFGKSTFDGGIEAAFGISDDAHPPVEMRVKALAKFNVSA